MKLLRILVGALLVSTAVHYTDNWLQIGDYGPETGLLADEPWLIPLSWALFAAVGIAGYREYGRGPSLRAHVLLGVFSLSGLITPLHLAYDGNDFAAWQWVSVMADFVTGLALLTFVLWSTYSRSAASADDAVASAAPRAQL